MSVLIPDNKVFENIFTKIMAYSYSKQCDINYCHVFSSYDEQQANEFVKNLLQLNEQSYLQRYKGEENENLQDFLKLSYKGEAMDTIQMLKYLVCIDYQIELHPDKLTFDDGTKPTDEILHTYKTLKAAIAAISQTIISERTNFKDLKWSEA